MTDVFKECLYKNLESSEEIFVYIEKILWSNFTGFQRPAEHAFTQAKGCNF